jgi:hypothetical protein
MTTATAPRILLIDAAVKRDLFAFDKPHIVRDSKIAGRHVWIGKRNKTFRRNDPPHQKPTRSAASPPAID